jgi:multicomponent Na+:H+ antiporter subunit D
MSSMANIIPFFIAVPFFAAFLITITGKEARRLPDVIVVIVTLGMCLWSFVGLWAVHVFGPLVYSAGGWSPPMGISLVLDGLSAFLVTTVNLVMFLIFLYATQYMEQYTSKWKFCSLFLLMLVGMNGVILTGDIFNLYVFLEIASIASFSLVAFGVERHQFEAAFKYAVMSVLGSLFVFLGIALLYGYTSTLNMGDMAGFLMQKPSSNLVNFVSLLFIMGFGLKAALVPFHAWLPDAHPAAPAPVSAMLSGVLIKSLGIYILCRIFFNVLGLSPMVAGIFMFLGTLSMVVGGLSAIGQNDIKRLMAYSSISQMGYIFLGLGLATPLSVFAALFHLFNHSIFKSLLFLNAGAVEYATGTRDMKKLGGLMQRMPVTSSTNFIGAMSISGVPPFSGFWSKLLIILAAVAAGHFWYAFWAIVASVLTLAAFLKVFKCTFRGALTEATAKAHEVPILMRSSMVVLALICILGGWLMMAQPRSFFLAPAVNVVLGGQSQYSKTVLEDLP